jgi:hypothetical protein
MCVPNLLTVVEVSSPKTINVKQYLNTNNFTSKLSANWGHTYVTKVLLDAGASPHAVDNDVSIPSVKLRQSNIKLLKFHMKNVM